MILPLYFQIRVVANENCAFKNSVWRNNSSFFQSRINSIEFAVNIFLLEKWISGQPELGCWDFHFNSFFIGIINV